MALLAVAEMSPVGAVPTGSTDPAHDLVDGQVVHLVVDGLPVQPGVNHVEIVQCRAPGVDVGDCGNNNGPGNTGGGKHDGPGDGGNTGTLPGTGGNGQPGRTRQ